MSPVGATRQENIIAAPFWPFLIKSAVSILFTSDSGPAPSKAGRYIGSAGVVEGDGACTICEDAKSTMSKKLASENARNHMGRYASGTRRFFKRNLVLI